MVMASLVPRPSPSFPSVELWLNRTASDGKLGKGLGTRLGRTASDGKLGEDLGTRLGCTASDGKLGEGLGSRLGDGFLLCCRLRTSLK